MPTFYHGSPYIFLQDLVKRFWKDVKNIRKKTPDESNQSGKKKEYQNKFLPLIESNNWEEAQSAMLNCVEEARQQNDHTALHHLAACLERLGAYQHAYKTRAQANSILRGTNLVEWDGKKNKSTHLVIHPPVKDRSSISYAIQYAPMFQQAANRVGSCEVHLDSRLIPLCKRTFPEIEFVALSEEVDVQADGAPTGKSLFCGMEKLPEFFGDSAKKIGAAHTPLVADADLVATFRSKYRKNSKPVIGIAWGSTNSGKDVPKFKDWRNLLKGLDAHVVSIQYGPVGNAVRLIGWASGHTIVFDKSVDQFANIDQFAAQLASLDAIVTVSNTGAHLAGNMGIPMIVLLDDKFHLTWPYAQNSTPWYPNATLLRKNKRIWPQVLDEARGLLDGILARKKSKSD